MSGLWHRVAHIPSFARGEWAVAAVDESGCRYNANGGTMAITPIEIIEAVVGWFASVHSITTDEAAEQLAHFSDSALLRVWADWQASVAESN